MQEGVDLPSPAPLQRWDTDASFDPTPGRGSNVYTRFGTFLTGLQDFDAAAFKLSQAEVLPLDPHARLLLEHTQVSCMRSAGMPGFWPNVWPKIAVELRRLSSRDCCRLEAQPGSWL